MHLIGVDGAVIDAGQAVNVRRTSDGRFVAPIAWEPAGRQSGPQCTNFPLNCINIGVFVDGVALKQMAPATWVPDAFYYDATSRRIVLASDPGDSSVEVTRAASGISSAAPDVVLKDLVVEHAATRGIVAAGPRWHLDDVTSRWNHTYGILTDGNVYVMEGGRFDHIGQYGLTGTGDRGLIESIESDHNDQLRFGTSLNPAACWDSGESKWVKTTGLVVRDAYVHDGYCNGFWFDLGNRDVTVTGSQFVDNFGFGLIQETSHGARISDNQFSGNRYFGLGIVSSSDVQARANSFTGMGLLLHQQGRAGVVRTIRCPGQATECPQVTRDNVVANNDFSCPKSYCARVLSQAAENIVRSTNELTDNQFSVGDPNIAHFAIGERKVDAAGFLAFFSAAST